MDSDFDAQWDELAEEVLSGMKAWRLHGIASPRATFGEIEQAWDERLARMRVRMLHACGSAALASVASDLKRTQGAERPVCPECGAQLEARGTATRELTTQHNQSVILTRSYGVCPQCGAGFFPPG